MKMKARSFGFSAIAIVALMLATLICSFTVMASAADPEIQIANTDLVFDGLTQTATGIYTKEYDGATDVTVSLTDAAKAKLPEGVDMLEFVKKASAAGVSVVPGNAFLCDGDAPCEYVRLNFSTPSDEDIVKGVKILGEVAKTY